MRVELDATAVDAAFAAITKDFQKQAQLPGFRPGKAPRAMVEKKYGAEIKDEAKRKLIGDNYRKAIEEKKIQVIGYPDIEEVQFERGQPLRSPPPSKLRRIFSCRNTRVCPRNWKASSSPTPTWNARWKCCAAST